VAQGNVSHYRYGDPLFAGADLVILDGLTWRQFWALHTSGLSPAPEAIEPQPWGLGATPLCSMPAVAVLAL